MSYCSENKLPLTTNKKRLFEIIELLGYIESSDPLKTEGQIGNFYWAGTDKDISFVGIELFVYRKEDCISVQTRTRVGRSYWDLKQQNKTISLLKSIFGGDFNTDEGCNRYMTFEDTEPSKLECSLFVSRWVFKNAISKVQIYLQTRELKSDLAKDQKNVFPWMDDLNPRLLSNNMIIPYIIGCWETYYRNSFISIMKYGEGISENALKKCRFTNIDILSVIRGMNSLEYVVADSLSFQRPSIIHENFKQLYPQINIQGILSKPYHRRKTTLFDSITGIIDNRDMFVHSGSMDTTLYDKQISTVITDLTEAVNRVYDCFGETFGFTPSYDF